MKGGNKKIDPFGSRPYQGEVMSWPDDLIKELNRDGGIRMFSFGDYRPQYDFESVAKLLSDAQQRGLNIKAITKQPEFVKTFGNHPNLRINISIDNVPREISVNAPTMAEALELKGGRENIKIRAVALNPEEAVKFGKDPNVDVVTLYHGLTNFSKGVRHDKLFKIVKEQNPEMVKRLGEENVRNYLDTWKSMPPAGKIHKEIEGMFKNKVCCTGGKCSKDPTKCGFQTGAILLGGVLLPNVDE